MSIWQFKVKTTKDLAYDLSEIFEDYADVISLFEDPQDQTLWAVEGTCEQKPNSNELEEIVKNYDIDSASSFEIIELPDKDWLAENRKDFQPLEIAGFYIYGSHIEKPKWGNNIPLKIDASTAFGTGNHGTTHGCLAALQYLKNQGIHPRNPLDLGCGTGILALGTAKLFNTEVTASDIDPDATEKTLYNAQENNATNLIFACTAEGFNDETLIQKVPFDLIIANILAGPLVDMANDIKRAITKGGYLILSGILDHQAEKVKNAYIDSTLCLVKESYIKEWATLIFKKQTIQNDLKSRMDFSIQING